MHEYIRHKSKHAHALYTCIVHLRACGRAEAGFQWLCIPSIYCGDSGLSLESTRVTAVLTCKLARVHTCTLLNQGVYSGGFTGIPSTILHVYCILTYMDVSSTCHQMSPSTHVEKKSITMGIYTHIYHICSIYCTYIICMMMTMMLCVIVCIYIKRKNPPNSIHLATNIPMFLQDFHFWTRCSWRKIRMNASTRT